MSEETAIMEEQKAAMAVPIVNPARAWEWVCLDIETIAGTPTDAERWMRLNWAPNRNWKPATIGQRYLDMLESKEQKLALLDEAPIISVSCKTNTGELRCLHWMYAHAPKTMHGGLVESFADEKGMLTAVRALLDSCVGPETVIVGHNIRGFDLPKLRMADLRAGLRLPVALAVADIELFDTMLEYGRRFTLSDRPFVALGDLLEIFGIESHKAACSGAQVGELYTAGEFDSIIRYALLDVIAESELFLKMTGQRADLV